MTDYPSSSITIIDAASFTESVEDVSVQPSDTDGGYLISRPRFTRKPRTTYSFKYVSMTDASKNVLRDFWKSVYGRSNAFNWVHPITQQTINVRFSMEKLDFNRSGYGLNNRWDSTTISMTEV